MPITVPENQPMFIEYEGYQALQDLAIWIEHARQETAQLHSSQVKSELGQFLTPWSVAEIMASYFGVFPVETILLDAGAGVGTLTSAVITQVCTLPSASRPSSFHADVFEIDILLHSYLEKTMQLCKIAAQYSSIEFTYRIISEDFVLKATEALVPGLFFRERLPYYTNAILNPPYKKISSASITRKLLRRVNIETSNIYTGFLSLAVKLLDQGGELVSISPRSFCNGPYFRGFRRFLLDEMTPLNAHLFNSRQDAFKDDQVLQETVILHTRKGQYPVNHSFNVVTSTNAHTDDTTIYHQDMCDFVRDRDRQFILHFIPDELTRNVVEQIQIFQDDLPANKLAVSTGRVVDFRSRDLLLQAPEANSVPLLYPVHFHNMGIKWPVESKKPNALRLTSGSPDLLVPDGYYVLVRRLSSKEESRRIVAVVYEPGQLRGAEKGIAFENHLNYYHCHGQGLDREVAYGLAVFLNSTLVDSYFRIFNGHTQVNAADLACLPYPSLQQLIEIGKKVDLDTWSMEQADEIIEEITQEVAGKSFNSKRTVQRISEAKSLLVQLGMPRQQTNVRSALTLLALLDLTPDKNWSEAGNPLVGISPAIDFMKNHYGMEYKENTREAVRRQTMHQFVAACIARQNPDKPRPVNSPQTVYQVTPEALNMIRVFGTLDWPQALLDFTNNAPSLAVRYAAERDTERIPLSIGDQEYTLSPGKHSDLIVKIINDFGPIYAPGGKPLYVGDTEDKWIVHDPAMLARLGLAFKDHGKMPDVLIYYEEKNWLLIVEAVTSHGPVDPKRHQELSELFATADCGLVFVTAFHDRSTLTRYITEIAWETEVWVAENPTHLIHFNGVRFLGPYGSSAASQGVGTD